MALIAAGIISGGTLASAGLQAWFNSEAQEEALKEHRRSEALNIKFAEKESKRVESRFGRNLKLGQEHLALSKGNSVVQQTQNQMDNLMNMMNSNSNLSNQLISNLRGRK